MCPEFLYKGFGFGSDPELSRFEIRHPGRGSRFHLE